MRLKISWIKYTEIKTILNFKDGITLSSIVRKTGKTAGCIKRMLNISEENDIMTSVISGRKRHFSLTKKGKSLRRELSKFTAVLQKL